MRGLREWGTHRHLIPCVIDPRGRGLRAMTPGTAVSEAQVHRTLVAEASIPVSGDLSWGSWGLRIHGGVGTPPHPPMCPFCSRGRFGFRTGAPRRSG